jgi:uracil-DNA glycosylase
MDCWDDLKFFQSGEWQVIQERLADMDKAKITYCPARENIFASFDVLPFEDVRVMIMGQDPYPDPAMATGIAFSIAEGVKKFPPSLLNIFKEYVLDLKYPMPTTGNLMPWVEQGVFLWNASPVCKAWTPLSCDWPEWQELNIEIIQELSKREIVFVFLGGRAREYAKYVGEGCEIIETSHPSPRGVMASKTPIIGSRLFSTINAKLNKLRMSTIEWRLR